MAHRIVVQYKNPRSGKWVTRQFAWKQVQHGLRCGFDGPSDDIEWAIVGLLVNDKAACGMWWPRTSRMTLME